MSHFLEVVTSDGHRKAVERSGVTGRCEMYDDTDLWFVSHWPSEDGFDGVLAWALGNMRFDHGMPDWAYLWDSETGEVFATWEREVG